MPRPFLARLRAAGPYLVVGVHVAVSLLGLLLWLGAVDQYFPGEEEFIFVVGFPPAQAMLLAAWAALGRRRLRVRLPLAGLGILCLTICNTLAVEQESERLPLALMFVWQTLLVGAGAYLGSRWRVPRGIHDAQSRERGSQFSIRKLFLWTAMAGVTLALMRCYPPRSSDMPDFPESLLTPVLGTFTACQVLIVLWWFSQPSWRMIAVAAPTAVLAVAGLAVAEPLTLVPFARSYASLVAAILTAYTLLQGSIVLVTLLLLRICRPLT